MKKLMLSVAVFMFVFGSSVAMAQDPVKTEKPATEQTETTEEAKEETAEPTEEAEEAPAEASEEAAE